MAGLSSSFAPVPNPQGGGNPHKMSSADEKHTGTFARRSQLRVEYKDIRGTCCVWHAGIEADLPPPIMHKPGPVEMENVRNADQCFMERPHAHCV